MISPDMRHHQSKSHQTVLEDKNSKKGAVYIKRIKPWFYTSHNCHCHQDRKIKAKKDRVPTIITSFQVGCVCVCVCVCTRAVAQSRLTLGNPTDCSLPAPLSVRFSRQEYWSGLPFPPPGALLDPGIEPEPLVSPALAGRFFTTAPLEKPPSKC